MDKPALVRDTRAPSVRPRMNSIHSPIRPPGLGRRQKTVTTLG